MRLGRGIKAYLIGSVDGVWAVDWITLPDLAWAMPCTRALIVPPSHSDESMACPVLPEIGRYSTWRPVLGGTSEE